MLANDVNIKVANEISPAVDPATARQITVTSTDDNDFRGKQSFQRAKAVARNFQLHFTGSKPPDNAKGFLGFELPIDVQYYGVAPFDAKAKGAGLDGITFFYDTLHHSFKNMRRREDVFIAGTNEVDTVHSSTIGSREKEQDGTGKNNVWVCSMGHYMGQFDEPFLNIPATGRLCCVRYCEFYHISDRKISILCTHIDILSIMAQANVYPLAQPTGAHFPYVPGPRTHDGVISVDGSLEVDARETKKTSELLKAMLGTHNNFNKTAEASGNTAQGCTPEAMRPQWHEDVLWYGPYGIGATGLSIVRYQRQHQLPFRENLYDKKFHGHVARIAEGKFEAWFGWPNLTNKSSGGFLGLPASDMDAEMRVIDVYHRDGEKLAENWVFIDMIHYLKTRGLDVLARMEELSNVGTMRSKY